MLDILLKTIVTFLICYSLIDVGFKLFDLIFMPKKFDKDKIFVVVKIIKPEKNLEYIVRGIIWNNLNCSKGGSLPYVLIVDMGGDEETSRIGRRLAKDYDFIYYTNHDNVDDFLKNNME